MANIEYVKKVDDLIPLKTILVSCTNKEGLVSNKKNDGSIIKELPEKGLLGFIHQINPDVKFISTGGTFKLIKSRGLPCIEVSDFTGFPEMKTGLVKSLHPKVHAGLLAHRYTESDNEFMKNNNLEYIDALIVNFYNLDEMMKKEGATFEMLRQSIDVGGPTMGHNARKAMISTALLTDPEDYAEITTELEKTQGNVSLRTRLKLVKKASAVITRYMSSVNDVFQKLDYRQLEDCYEIVNRS